MNDSEIAKVKVGPEYHTGYATGLAEGLRRGKADREGQEAKIDYQREIIIDQTKEKDQLLALNKRLVEALKKVCTETVSLSRDYLEAFRTDSADTVIQGWDKARWERALAAKEEARALLSEIKEK